jgi:hypothetical protein
MRLGGLRAVYGLLDFIGESVKLLVQPVKDFPLGLIVREVAD